MKRWIQRRHDSRPQPADRYRRARRLAIERCEDRCMLSGTTLDTEFVSLTSGGAGGFIALDTSAWLLSGSSNSLVGDFAFDLSGQVTPAVDQQVFANNQLDVPSIKLSVPLYVGTNSTSGDAVPRVAPSDGDAVLKVVPTDDAKSIAKLPELPQAIPPSLPTAPGDPATESYQSPTPGPNSPRELTDPTSEKSLDFRPPWDYDDALDIVDVPNDSTVDPPGLTGKTAVMRLIDDPIIIIDENSASRYDDQGGTLPIFDAVATAQRDYETQLLAAVAQKLDRDDVLPARISPTSPPQPVAADLARVVAYEAFDRRSGGQVNAEEPTADPTAVDFDNVPTEMSTPTVDRSSESSVGVEPAPTTVSKRANNHANGTVQQVARPIASPSDPSHYAPTERIDNERETAYAAAFSEWPLLASVAVLSVQVGWFVYRAPNLDKSKSSTNGRTSLQVRQTPTTAGG
ncbi:MAG: hypothetical protein AAGD11_14780 [Planctomycetota bacterium]